MGQYTHVQQARFTGRSGKRGERQAREKRHKEETGRNTRIRREHTPRQYVGEVPRVEFGLAVGRLIGRKLRFGPVKSRARGRSKGLRRR